MSRIDGSTVAGVLAGITLALGLIIGGFAAVNQQLDDIGPLPVLSEPH